MFRLTVTILFGAMMAMLGWMLVPTAVTSFAAGACLAAIIIATLYTADTLNKRPALRPTGKPLSCRIGIWFALYWLPAAIGVSVLGALGVFTLKLWPPSALLLTLLPALNTLGSYVDLSWLRLGDHR